MADPRTYFGLPPSQPDTLFFNENTGLHNTKALGELMQIRDQTTKFEVGQRGAEQALRELDFRRRADEQMEQILPEISSLDVTSPDYLKRRTEIEAKAPFASLSPLVKQMLGERDELYTRQQYANRYAASAGARRAPTEVDLARVGVTEEEVNKIRLPDGSLHPELGVHLQAAAIRRQATEKAKGGTNGDMPLGKKLAIEKYFKDLEGAGVQPTPQQIKVVMDEIDTVFSPQPVAPVTQKPGAAVVPPAGDMPLAGLMEQAAQDIASMDVIKRKAFLATLNPAARRETEKLMSSIPLPPIDASALPKTRGELEQRKAQQANEQKTAALASQTKKNWEAAEDELRKPLLANLPTDPQEMLVELQAIYNMEPVDTDVTDPYTGALIGVGAHQFYLKKLGVDPSRVHFSDPTPRWGTQKVTSNEVVRALARKLFFEKTGVDLGARTQGGAPVAAESPATSGPPKIEIGKPKPVP